MMNKPSRQEGQSLVEFAIVMPVLVLLSLGIVEVGYALLDQHVVTKLTREGSNLISRDVTIQDAATAMQRMSTRPIDFSNGSRLIFSVLRKGATVGTPNYDQVILYQRYAFGSLSMPSKLQTRGGGSFQGPPDYQARNADTDVNLQITNVPAHLSIARGGMLYVTEVYTRHDLITPFNRLGPALPDVLYSVAYF